MEKGDFVLVKGNYSKFGLRESGDLKKNLPLVTSVSIFT